MYKVRVKGCVTKVIYTKQPKIFILILLLPSLADRDLCLDAYFTGHHDPTLWYQSYSIKLEMLCCPGKGLSPYRPLKEMCF